MHQDVPNINFARIITPEGVEAQRMSLLQKPQLPPYMLHAELENSILQRFEANSGAGVRLRFTVYPTLSFAHVAVATVQVGSVQLRTAVPLVDGPPRNWMENVIESKQIAWLLDAREARQAVLVRMACAFPNPQELRLLLSGGHDPTPDELAVSLEMLGRALCEVEAIESCFATEVVAEAHVRVVFPRAALDAAVRPSTNSSQTRTKLH